MPRPPAPPTSTYSLRLSDSLWEEVDAAASTAGVKRSAWLRSTIEEKLHPSSLTQPEASRSVRRKVKPREIETHFKRGN
jgi:hypothetical protein